MKRILAIAICFSILYAGAVSVYAGCENLGAASAGHDHGGQNGGHHHGDASVPQHSDSGKIHCANLFGAFLVGARTSLDPELRVSTPVTYHALDIASVWPRSNSCQFDLGPPGPIVSAIRPLHLLLSVIRT
jgi:hypothetical protein